MSKKIRNEAKPTDSILLFYAELSRHGDNH